jgi:Predicted phosphoadenosine phosphosulfate sulfotransferase
MPKTNLSVDVLAASKNRIEWTFDNFDRIYCSFSAGKDSGVMAHLVCQEARKRGRKIGLFFLDWEAQFSHTIDFARLIFDEYKDCTDPYWVSVPVKTWNACSMHEPEWTAWDEQKRNVWVREKDDIAIKDGNFSRFGTKESCLRNSFLRLVSGTRKERSALHLLGSELKNL